MKYYFKDWVRKRLKIRYWILPKDIMWILNRWEKQCYNYMNGEFWFDENTANMLLEHLKIVPTEWVFKIERLLSFDDLFINK